MADLSGLDERGWRRVRCRTRLLGLVGLVVLLGTCGGLAMALVGAIE